MPQYTLNYFNVRGRGQLMRLMFTQAEVQFTDNRIEFKDWPEEKKNSVKFPFGCCPSLEVDGTIIPETLPMGRFLANELGLCGKTNMDKAWCDVFVECINDLKTACLLLQPFHRAEKDDAKYAQLVDETCNGVVAKKLAILEGFLGKNNGGKGFLVGDELTWADLQLIDFVDTSANFRKDILDATPLLKAVSIKVSDLPKIKAFMDARAPTVI